MGGRGNRTGQRGRDPSAAENTELGGALEGEPGGVAVGELPIPGLEPRGVTLEEFTRFMPRSLGFTGDDTPENPDEASSRRRVLALLLVNTGLAEAVRFAPREAWLQALDREYGPVH